MPRDHELIDLRLTEREIQVVLGLIHERWLKLASEAATLDAHSTLYPYAKADEVALAGQNAGRRNGDARRLAALSERIEAQYHG